MLLNVFDIPAKTVREESSFYEKTYKIIPVTIDYLTNYTTEPKNFIKEYIEDKDTTG